jgi:hypothetical protein
MRFEPKTTLFAAVFVSALFLPGCGGGSTSDTPTTTSPIIINKAHTIEEGMQLSYPLVAGNYLAEITSSNNGVIISWPGGSNCAASQEVKTYSSSCVLTSQGQLVIVNPTLLGLGGAEIVTIKVTKL